LATLQPLLEEALAKQGEYDAEGCGYASEDERLDDAASAVERDHAGFIRALRARYGAPELAGLIYTGSEDERPGRCHTPPGVWLLGIGLLVFPADVPPAFREVARWHTWVEAG
jgi:hypothetical protein